MLVLSRQRDESVMIGDAIEVRVVDVRGEKVRLGFVAPRDVAVHRKEVYETIRENRAAAEATIPPAQVRDLKMPPQAKMRLVPQAQIATDDPLLRAILEEAHLAMEDGDLPIGAALVRDGVVLGRGRDGRVRRGDPMAFAELDCFRNAARQPAYVHTALYCTAMPTLLGAAAVVQLGVPRVVVGASVAPPGQTGADLLRSHGVEVVELRDLECAELPAHFTRTHPGRWDAAGR